jgi:hypothetical protein
MRCCRPVESPTLTAINNASAKTHADAVVIVTDSDDEGIARIGSCAVKGCLIDKYAFQKRGDCIQVVILLAASSCWPALGPILARSWTIMARASTKLARATQVSQSSIPHG